MDLGPSALVHHPVRHHCVVFEECDVVAHLHFALVGDELGVFVRMVGLGEGEDCLAVVAALGGHHRHVAQPVPVRFDLCHRLVAGHFVEGSPLVLLLLFEQRPRRDHEVLD